MKKLLQLKPLFIERMKELLGEDLDKYLKSLDTEPPRSIRCNTLKITPENLKKRLEQKKWKITQPLKQHPEIMIVEGKFKGNLNVKENLVSLHPGELGRSLEHVLGYYYVQEFASMLPAIILNPQPDEKVLDLCASPGSKTTQIASKMKNTGTLIANDIQLNRIKILASNLERSGVANAIITKKEGFALCNQAKKYNLLFDKILIDAPCSGEGTLRTSPKTAIMWNIHSVKSLSNIQKNLLSNAIDILKIGGEIVYSTCTHSPEENEEVLSKILEQYPNMKIEKISLPIKISQGITNWQEKEYLEEVKYSCRIYPHEYDTEGFFIAKLKKMK